MVQQNSQVVRLPHQSNPICTDIIAQSEVSNELNDTPYSNTGSKCQGIPQVTTGIDFWVGVATVASLGQVKEIVKFYTGWALGKDAGRWHEGKVSFAGVRYHHQWRSRLGLLVQYSLPEDLGGGRGRVRVTLPGKFWNELSGRDQWRFIHSMDGASRPIKKGFLPLIPVFRTTRLDLKIDIKDKREFLDEIVKARLQKNYNHAKRRTTSYIESESIVEGKKVVGRTVNFSKRSADKMLRCYDKWVESKGRTDATRMEGEFHDEQAQQALEVIRLVSLDDFHQAIGRLVLGVVRFVDTSVDKRVDRCNDLPWYALLKEAVGGTISLASQPSQCTIEKIMKWVENQVLPSLAVVKAVHGVGAFNKWFTNGMVAAKERWSSNQRLLIESYTGCLQAV